MQMLQKLFKEIKKFSLQSGLLPLKIGFCLLCSAIQEREKTYCMTYIFN